MGKASPITTMGEGTHSRLQGAWTEEYQPPALPATPEIRTMAA